MVETLKQWHEFVYPALDKLVATAISIVRLLAIFRNDEPRNDHNIREMMNQEKTFPNNIPYGQAETNSPSQDLGRGTR